MVDLAAREEYLANIGNDAWWVAMEQVGGDDIASTVSNLFENVTAQEVEAAYEKWKDTAKSSGKSRGLAGESPKKN